MLITSAAKDKRNGVFGPGMMLFMKPYGEFCRVGQMQERETIGCGKAIADFYIYFQLATAA